MASMPYQVLLMKIRHIYRWDDPAETALWLMSYIIAWAVGHLGGAAVRQAKLARAEGKVFSAADDGQILITVFLVVRRHINPPSLEDLRRSIKRSEDIDQTATNFTQLIEQHGSRGWVDALIRDLGPRSLLQIEDMADTLEILRK